MRIIPALALGFLLSFGPVSAIAQMGHDHGSKGMSHGGMGHEGMGMGAMHARMKALHDHSKMMEGITDQKRLGEEMKKHMRMMDEMMDQMMAMMMQSDEPSTTGR